MKIVSAQWTHRINMLTVECEACGKRFQHPTNRWRVMCPSCSKTENLGDMRARIVKGDIE